MQSEVKKAKRLCKLIQEQDERFVSVVAKFYDYFYTDSVKICVRIRSERFNTELLIDYLLTEEAFLGSDLVPLAKCLANLFLVEFDRAERERALSPSPTASVDRQDVQRVDGRTPDGRSESQRGSGQ